MDPMPSTPTNAQSAVNEFSQRVTDAVGQVTDKASDWSCQAVDCMRKNPMSSALIAVGVGAFVGFLLSNRR